MNIEDKCFIGKKVKVDHPITVLNPDEFFEIKYVRIEGSVLEPRIYVRGETTMWFSSKLIIDEEV